MSERGRGLYGDADAAARVLAALGGSTTPRPAYPSPPMYRGRCGNRATKYDGADGCPAEVAPPPNPLGLCAECLVRYRSLMTSDAALSTFEHTGVTCLPTHECVSIDPVIVARVSQNKDLILDANTCGRFDPVTHIVTCTERRVYVRCDCPRHPDAPTRGNKKCQKCKTVGFVVVEKIPTNCGARFRRNLYGLCEQIW